MKFACQRDKLYIFANHRELLSVISIFSPILNLLLTCTPAPQVKQVSFLHQMTSKCRQPLHSALSLAACGMKSMRLATFDKIVELRRETVLLWKAYVPNHKIFWTWIRNYQQIIFGCFPSNGPFHKGSTKSNLSNTLWSYIKKIITISDQNCSHAMCKCVTKSESLWLSKSDQNGFS